jgi:hypothetical protein
MSLNTQLRNVGLEQVLSPEEKNSIRFASQLSTIKRVKIARKARIRG